MIYVQRIYDKGLGQFVYYSLTSITTTPSATQTSPNHSGIGNLDTSTHSVTNTIGTGEVTVGGEKAPAGIAQNISFKGPNVNTSAEGSNVTVTISPGNGTTMYDIIVDPGSSTIDNTYCTLNEAYEASVGSNGLKQIFFASDTVVEDNTQYDLSQYIFTSEGSTLTFGGKATVSKLPTEINNLTVQNTAGPIANLEGEHRCVLKNSVLTSEDGAESLLKLGKDAKLVLKLDECSRVGGNPKSQLITGEGKLLLELAAAHNVNGYVAGGNVEATVRLNDTGVVVPDNLFQFFSYLSKAPTYCTRTQQFRCSDVLSSNQNDYAPLGWDFCSHLYLGLTGNLSATGFKIPTGNELTKFLHNTSQFTLMVPHMSAASAEGNRVLTPAGSRLTVPPGAVLMLSYDNEIACWRAYVLGNSANTGFSGTYVYNPAAVPAGNLYNNLSALMTARTAALASGMEPLAQIVLSDSVVIDSGDWDFTGCTFKATKPVTVTFSGSATLSMLPELLDNVGFVSQKTSGSLVSGLPAQSNVRLRNSGNLLVTGTTPFFSLSSRTGLKIINEDLTGYVRGAGDTTPLAVGGEVLICGGESTLSSFVVNGTGILRWHDYSYDLEANSNVASCILDLTCKNEKSVIFRNGRNTNVLAITYDNLMGDLHDYSEVGWTLANTVRLSSYSECRISGLDASVAVLRKRLVNVGSFAFWLLHEDGNSSTANQIICPSSISYYFTPGSFVYVEYDIVSERWRIC
jgi:hypothetical protein